MLYSRLAALFLMAALAASCGGSTGSDRPADSGNALKEVTLVAKSSIQDPSLLVQVEGDFVGPDRDAFASHASFGDVYVDERVVRIGDQAWVRSGDTWEKKPIDDKDLSNSFDLSPGQLQFWSDFDPSKLTGLSGPREKINGVDAIRITFTRDDVQLLAKLFDANEADLKGLQEFTLWLSEKDRWPVGLRAVLFGDQDFLSANNPDKQKGTPPDNAPPKLLDSFHYGLSVAAKKETDEAGAPRYRIEFIMAISRVNDDSITIKPPL